MRDRTEIMNRIVDSLWRKNGIPPAPCADILFALLPETEDLQEVSFYLEEQEKTVSKEDVLRFAMQVAGIDLRESVETKEMRLCRGFENTLAEYGRLEAERILDNVINTLKSFDEKSGMLQSGQDSGLKNIWEEFCVQVQGQQFSMWNHYESLVEQLIEKSIEEEPLHVRRSIWLLSEDAQDWDIQCPDNSSETCFEEYFNDDFPVFLNEAVADYLYDELLRRAADNEEIVDYLYEDYSV